MRLHTQGCWMWCSWGCLHHLSAKASHNLLLVQWMLLGSILRESQLTIGNIYIHIYIYCNTYIYTTHIYIYIYVYPWSIFDWQYFQWQQIWMWTSMWNMIWVENVFFGNPNWTSYVFLYFACYCTACLLTKYACVLQLLCVFADLWNNQKDADRKNILKSVRVLSWTLILTRLVTETKTKICQSIVYIWYTWY